MHHLKKSKLQLYIFPQEIKTHTHTQQSKSTMTGPDGYASKVNQKYKKEILPNLCTFFQKTENEEILLNSFLSTCITLWYSQRTLAEEKTTDS